MSQLLLVQLQGAVNIVDLQDIHCLKCLGQTRQQCGQRVGNYPVLGVQVVQKAEEQPSSSVRLHLAGKDAKAEGTETADGFVVYAGSLGRAAEVPSIHAYGTQLRAAMLEKGLFAEAGKHFRLTEDYVFASPSAAAMVMLGRTSNGRVEWKTADGQTLKELQTADASGES